MDPSRGIYVLVTNEAGIGNTLKGCITGLTITDSVVIANNYNALLGNYSEVLDNSHIGEKDGREVFSTNRFLILKDEENEQPDLLNEYSKFRMKDSLTNSKFYYIFSEHYIDWYYDRTLICDRVFNRIMAGIDKIKWNDIVTREVNKYSSSINENMLGVSIRSWTAPHEHNINRAYLSSDYIQSILKMVNENNIKNIFISYDNINIKGEYKAILESNTVIEYDRPAHITELQYAVIKMLILSKCKYFICNRISTYSELVFWFSRCSQKVLALY
jgi:hypothetical protein